MDYRLVLIQLGITPNYKGYHQMLTALEIVEADLEALTLVTKRPYPAVWRSDLMRVGSRWNEIYGP